MKRRFECERFFSMIELRADNANGEMRVGGYAAVFQVESSPILGFFREVIHRGAFSKTLRERDQIYFWNHDRNEILARRSNNTLTLVEDERGLRFDAILANTTRGRDVYELIRRGDVREMSFGFRVPIGKDAWSLGLDGLDRRDVYEIDLGEISSVPEGAYENTEVEIRALWESNAQSQKQQGAGDAAASATSEPGTSANHSEAGDAWRVRSAERERVLKLMDALPVRSQ